MKILWCEVHLSAQQRDETQLCRAHWMVKQISDVKPSPCRFGEVPMRLIPDNALETVWFCWLHKSAGIPGTYFCEMAGQASFVDSMLMDGLDPRDPKHHQMVEVQILIPALEEEIP